MLLPKKHRAIVQLLAITLQNSLLGLSLFTLLPEVSEHVGDYRAAGESRLIALNDFIENGGLSQSVKRFDNHGLERWGTLKIATADHKQVFLPVKIHPDERHYRFVAAGALPIRSPPVIQFL
jgi:hypothetical protein